MSRAVLVVVLLAGCFVPEDCERFCKRKCGWGRGNCVEMCIEDDECSAPEGDPS